MTDISKLPRRLFLQTVAATSFLSRGVKGQSSNKEVYGQRSQDTIRIGNSQIELTFRRDNGGLEQFLDKDEGITYLTESDTPKASWSLRFYHQDYDNLLTGSWLAGSPDINISEESQRVSVILRWENSPLVAPSEGTIGKVLDGSIEVRVSIEENESVSRWKLNVKNKGDMAIRQTICPHITNIAPIGGEGNDALYIPSRLGRKYPNPVDLDYGPIHRYPSGFGTMQFVSYLANENGIYAAAEDSEGYTKGLEFNPRDDVLDYRARHYVSYSPGGDVVVPYEMTFGSHSGTWRDAADRYRAWVDSEGWLSDVDSMVTKRLRDRGITYHEDSYHRSESDVQQNPISFETIKEMALNIQKKLDVPIGFRWWGWQKNGNFGLGDWFPPYEGREKFDSVVQTLQSNNIDLVGFLSPTLVLSISDYWKSLENPDELPMKDRQGEFLSFTDDNTGLTTYQMSPLNSRWQNHYRGALTQLIESGFQHLALDGFPWKWTPDCWNDEHSHPKGRGGKWYPQGMRRLLKDLHTTYDVPDGLAIAGEGIADFYLPYMNVHDIRDGMAEFDDPSVRRGDAEVVPMFPYTFGDYAATRSLKGHIGTHTDQRNIQRLIAGRSVEWGAIPMFMGHVEPGPGDYDEALVDYYSRIGKARTGYASRFLTRGSMLGKPEIETNQITITQRGVETTTPDIRGRGWRADNGDLGIVLTSAAKSGPKEVSLDINNQPFDLPSEPVVYLVKNERYQLLDGLTVTLDFQPSDIVLIAVLPNESGLEQALNQIQEAQDRKDVNQDNVLAAKRAFDRHDFEKARALAKEAIQPPTEESGTTVRTQSKNETTTEKTETTSPGFGFGDSLPAIAGGIGLLKWWGTNDDGDN